MSIDTVRDDGRVREFETGASRGTKEGKLCYSGFFSPLVLHRVAEYMHKHRRMEDGSLREPDNWQKGMPVEEYMDSMWRHFFDVWANQRGWGEEVATEEDLVEALCGLFFNVQGMMHEVLREDQAKVYGGSISDAILNYTAGPDFQHFASTPFGEICTDPDLPVGTVVFTTAPEPDDLPPGTLGSMAEAVRNAIDQAILECYGADAEPGPDGTP